MDRKTNKQKNKCTCLDDNKLSQSLCKVHGRKNNWLKEKMKTTVINIKKELRLK